MTQSGGPHYNIRNVPQLQHKAEAVAEMPLRRVDVEEVGEAVDRLKPLGKSTVWASVCVGLLSLSVSALVTALVLAQSAIVEHVQVGIYAAAAVLMGVGAGLAWIGHRSVCKKLQGDVDVILKKLQRMMDSYESVGPQPPTNSA